MHDLGLKDMRIPRTLEFESVLEMLAARTVSPPGASAARRLRPSDDEKTVRTQMEHTKEAEAIYLSLDKYPMTGFSAADSELKRLKMGASLSIPEILRVAGVMRAARHAAAALAKRDEPYIPRLARHLVYDQGLLSRVDACIASEEELADDATPQLAKIRRSIRSENDKIQKRLQEMIRTHGQHLQDAIVTQRGGRYVLPVKAESRPNVPGIIHERSATGATFFVEPASVVEANNKIRELEGAEAEETARILRMLSDSFRSYRDDLREDGRILVELDVLFAKAVLARDQQASPVEFNDRYILEITEGRHPLIPKEEVIPVSVAMTDGIRALIVTGPNTGGKTVTLKMIGLFSAMAQSGLYIPTSREAHLPVFRGIFADIGDEQSIEQSLSTFSAHMKSIIYAVRHADTHSLILLDELGSGTDPQEGSALAQAVLDDLYQKGCMLIATTHIGELKDFAAGHDGFENASMEWSAQTLTPTYQLLMGVPGRSNALAISRSLGLPQSIIRAAESYMNTEAVEYARLIESAEKERDRARENAKRSKELLREARQQVRDAEARVRKAEEKRRSILDRANQKALDIVADAKETAEDAINEAKRLQKQPEAERTRSTQAIRGRLQDKRASIEKHERRHKEIEWLKKDEILPGMTVKVVPMDVAGTVLEAPNNKGVVRVQAGIMSLELPFSELARADEEHKPAAAAKKYDHVDLSSRANVGLSLDLHGLTVDEALPEVDQYLDDAFLAGLKKVSIVHGRGTGKLRNGIRNYLRTHAHVESMRPGEYDEGGDGATIVVLK